MCVVFVWCVCGACVCDGVCGVCVWCVCGLCMVCVGVCVICVCCGVNGNRIGILQFYIGS